MKVTQIIFRYHLTRFGSALHNLSRNPCDVTTPLGYTNKASQSQTDTTTTAKATADDDDDDNGTPIITRLYCIISISLYVVYH